MLTVKKVIYNPPATIILWSDGSKTMAKCDGEDKYSKEVGFMLCVLKKKYGNRAVKNMFDRYVYNTPEANYKGAVVIEEKPCFRKPKVHKKRIQVERPSYCVKFVDEDWDRWDTLANVLEYYLEHYNDEM